PLLTVDLDVDESTVHRRGDSGILERFVRHHVTPMARGVTDRQQDGLVLLARQPQRFLAPRIPIDRVVRVLLQIRAGLLRESIGHGKRSRCGVTSPTYPRAHPPAL